MTGKGIFLVAALLISSALLSCQDKQPPKTVAKVSSPSQVKATFTKDFLDSADGSGIPPGEVVFSKFDGVYPAKWPKELDIRKQSMLLLDGHITDKATDFNGHVMRFHALSKTNPRELVEAFNKQVPQRFGKVDRPMYMDYNGVHDASIHYITPEQNVVSVRVMSSDTEAMWGIPKGMSFVHYTVIINKDI
jgi:hypothetical protein